MKNKKNLLHNTKNISLYQVVFGSKQGGKMPHTSLLISQTNPSLVFLSQKYKHNKDLRMITNFIKIEL